MRAALRWLAALAGSLALASAARALDLAETWRAASRHDPEFAAARAAHDAGRARREQAAALWRPTVLLEGGVARATNEAATRGARFSAPGFGTSTGVAFDTSVTG
ncbi:MAG TPA: transporter, partial [Albitalea sp.]